MNKNIIATVIDRIGRYLIVFFIFFAWLRYYLYSLWADVILSAALTLLINIIIDAITNASQNKKRQSIAEQKKIENCAEQLKLMSNSARVDFLVSLINNAKNVKKSKKYAYFYKNTHKYMLFFTNDNKKEFIYDVISNYKNKCDRLILVADSWPDDCAIISKNLGSVILLDKVAMYNQFYLPQNKYPDAKIEIRQIEKVKIKDIALACIKRKNFSRYLMAGLVIMFASIIMPYNIYYIIWGSILLVISLICLISPSWSKPKQDDIFG